MNIYIDMDEVLADFSHSIAKARSIKLEEAQKSWNPPEMYEEGFFSDLRPIPGAIKTVKKIISLYGDRVHILTQPLADSPFSYGEKALWINTYLPELSHKLILTQNKSLIEPGILIDDNKAKWDTGHHKFIHFPQTSSNYARIKRWESVLIELQDLLGVFNENN